MARGIHEVVFEGGAHALVHVPPARVSSATCFVEDLTEADDGADRFIVSSGAATVDTYNVTLTADSGSAEADPRLMTHAGSSATAGTTYAIEAADGRTELFVADAVSATTIRARAPLSGDYPTGSTVRGVQLSVDFPAPAAADEDLFDANPPIRVTWIYTALGQAHRVAELVRLVRNKSSQRSLGSVETALREGWPELVKMLSPHGNALRDLVKRVADRLDAHMRGRGLDAEALLAGPLGFEVLLQRAVLHMAEAGYHPAERDAQLFVEDQRQEFARLWQSLTIGHSEIGAADIERLSDTAAPGNSKKSRNPFTRG